MLLDSAWFDPSNLVQIAIALGVLGGLGITVWLHWHQSKLDAASETRAAESRRRERLTEAYAHWASSAMALLSRGGVALLQNLDAADSERSTLEGRIRAAEFVIGCDDTQAMASRVRLATETIIEARRKAGSGGLFGESVVRDAIASVHGILSDRLEGWRAGR
ncbi:MAG: hypothetical protein U1E73_14115 [Planctomycetota bacterium]